ncbi:hypothetical protein CAEBREN_04700 [Caenorhabditis brenneri]|uniref:Uncharacterized protein n=1 Tax=Caenorhabditis brenneri TaxID=135651 RepID=G0MWI3_CAEBE|nr:hypothetical protein CAEBREN_04700 [Caenorhabditis brenneri]
MKSRTPSNREAPIMEAEAGELNPEDKMGADNKGPTSTMGAIQRFLNNTTAHGLPRISKARNQMGRGFWVFVWLAFFSVFCYQN